MNSTDLLERFRSDVFDTEQPFMWSDEDAIAYLNDAYFMFVRLTGGVSDMTSSATELDAATDEPFSDLHPSILNVRKAWRADGHELVLVNITDDLSRSDDDYGLNWRTMVLDTTTGPLKYLILGIEQDKVRLNPIPASDETIQLLVYRLPLEELVAEGQELPDVAKQHHIHLVSWMKALAYRKADQETMDLDKAAEYEGRFRAYCEQAKAEWERKKAKVRIVQYGGL